MNHQNENPEALAGAVRVIFPDLTNGLGNETEDNPDGLSFQAAYVASRYRLNPCIARLICQLAQIGGRFA